MNELLTINKETADTIYLKFKDVFLSKKNNPTFAYDIMQHNISTPINAPEWQKEFYQEIRPHYFNEQGSVTFKNANGNNVTLSLIRWHPHQHNAICGLNGNACIEAKIIENKNGVSDVIWQLKVTSGTLYYDAKVSELQLPKQILNTISIER